MCCATFLKSRRFEDIKYDTERYVWGINWGMSGVLSGASSGACLVHHLGMSGACLDHDWDMPGASIGAYLTHHLGMSGASPGPCLGQQFACLL